MSACNERLVEEISRLKMELQEENNKRKDIEQELKKFKEMFSAHREFLYKVIDTNPNHILVRNDKGKYVLANKAAASFYGLTPNELVGKTDQEFGLKVDEIAAVIREDHEVMTKLCKIVYEEQMNDVHGNNVFWQTVKVPVISAEGDSQQVLIVSTDITKHKQTERTLKVERDRAQKYLDVTEAMMIVINEDEEIIRINEKCCEIVEYSVTEIIGKNFFDAFVPDETREIDRKEFRRFMNGAVESLEYYECKIITKSGVEKLLELHNGALRDENGSIIACISSGQDITQRKVVDRMKSDLINTVSHEIRTPLASILGFTELLLKRELKKEKMDKYLDTMHKEATRLTYLINNFLDIQRMESGEQVFEKVSFNIDEVIHEILDIYTIDKTHLFSLKKDGSNYSVRGDLNRIKQLLTNLVSNAKKYSPDEDEITIEITEKAMALEVVVEDRGLGIPQEAIPKLFTKFYRVDNSDHRKIGGTGLGLVICKEIVEAHGGEIWIDSELGVGTKVCFSLPKAGYERQVIVDDTGDYILIVEDDVSLAQLIAENIQYTGFKHKIVTTGEKAIELIEQKTPVVLILDIKLAGELDGWNVLEIMRNKGLIKKMPVIISSALERPVQEMSKEVFDAYFVKPYSFDKLNQTIMNYFDSSKAITPRKEVGIVIQAKMENTENIIKKLSEQGFNI